jgi:hypothetical protein
MIRYSVTATLDKEEYLEEYCDWLTNDRGTGHMDAVLRGGALTSELSVFKGENGTKVNTLYTFLNSTQMNVYLTDVAPSLPTLTDAVNRFYLTKKVTNYDRFIATTGFYYKSNSVENPFATLPTMIRYTVTATLSSKDHLEDYLAWLSEGHIQAVVNAGGLTGEYNVLNQEEGTDNGMVQVASIYTFPNLEALNGYFNGVAAVLRQEGITRFVETKKVVKFDRFVGTIMKTTQSNMKQLTLTPIDLSPYLFFNGRCREAMTFYHQCLQGNLELMV